MCNCVKNRRDVCATVRRLRRLYSIMHYILYQTNFSHEPINEQFRFWTYCQPKRVINCVFIHVWQVKYWPDCTVDTQWNIEQILS